MYTFDFLKSLSVCTSIFILLFTLRPNFTSLYLYIAAQICNQRAFKLSDIFVAVIHFNRDRHRFPVSYVHAHINVVQKQRRLAHRVVVRPHRLHDFMLARDEIPVVHLLPVGIIIPYVIQVFTDFLFRLHMPASFCAS